MNLKVVVAGVACLVSASVSSQEAGKPAVSASNDTLAEVVVTARRREESLQSVPVAISVIGGDLLDSTRTVNTQQLTQLVPSLYYNSANPRNTAYTIRGLGSNTLSVSAANDGIEPGVGFYVDQVYHARPATAAFDFTDIERVEVLRGPQGTLFGKNTAAGTIHVVSREPTFGTEGNVEASAGSLDYVQAKGSLSGALGESVAGRISAQFTRRDGVIHNVVTGEDLNAQNNFAIRGQLLLQQGDDLKVRLIADMADLDATCCTQVYLRVGQSRRSAARQYPALTAGLHYSPPSTNVYDRLSDIDADLRIDTRDGGLALIADWQMPYGTVTSVSAWRFWDWDAANDRDYTGIPIQTVQRIPSRQDQYSQELRVASLSEGPLDYVGGLYFFTQEITGHPTSIYGPEAAYWLLNPASFSVAIPRNLLDGYGQTGASRFQVASYAAFGELNYRPTSVLTATLGLRYTYEDKTGVYATQVSGGPDLSALPAATQAELSRARLSILRPQHYSAADQGGSLSGRTNLAWQATGNLLAYASYAHGFKSGGLNMSGLPLDAQNNPALGTAVIRDERNDTVELGLKSTLLTGRATANLAAFHTTVKNYQANVVSSLETAALRSYPSNIPAVRVRGVEADLAALLLRGFAVRASASYSQGRNTDYPQGPCPLEVQTASTVACSLTGKPLAGLSNWVGSLGFNYRRPLGGGELVSDADWNVRSGYNSDTSISKYTRIGGYGVVNASLGYEFASGWQIDVFARNLFDKNYLTALTIQTGNSGLILGQPGDPRIVGLSIKARL